MAFALGTSAGAGTISVVAGGTIVTGVSTNFVAANVGAILVVGAQWGVIATRTSTTSVTLDRVFATAVTGSAYTISANIPVITQTGTDTSLANLTGVPGVTTSLNLWTLTSATLVINGSLTINRLTNRLRFLNPANLVTSAVTPPTLTIGATGTFNNSVSQTVSGYTYRSPNYSIMFDGVIPQPLAATTATLIGTVIGSTSVFEGNIEFANATTGGTTSVLTCNFEGTTTLQYGALLNSTSGNGANILFYVSNAASNLTLTSYSSYGISLRVADNTLTINNYAAVAGVNALNLNTGSAINNPQYVGLQDLGNTTALRTAAASLKYLQVINFSSTALQPGFTAGSNTGSQILFVNQLILSASGSSGAIQDVKFWARDSNNGSRSSTNYGAGLGYEIATTGNLTYTATTAASGIAPTLNIISAIYWQNTASTFVRDYRGNDSSTSQNLNIYSCAYNYVLANSLSNLYPLVNGVYGGAAARSQGFVLLTDTSITQATMATVAAYTALDTAQQFYDYAKYFLYTNFAGQTETYVTRSGNVVGAGSYNVIIDATASTPFAIAGSTITIKSAVYTGSLTTSGTVTLANGAILSGSTITGNVAQATPTNLTGITINGNLTYNTNTPITITLTNCTISGTVSNSGSGTVTISTSNTTIGAVGTQVVTRPITSLNLNGLTAGSQIYVADGSGTRVEYVASSGTSYTLDTTGGTGTYTYKVTRYGFTAQTGTHSPAVASTTVSISLIADAFITQVTAATVAAYTALNTSDRIYDYAAYWETTNTGIPIARVVSKIAAQAGIGSYNIVFDSAAASIWALASNTITVKTSTFSPGTTMTGGLFTSGNITVNSGVTVTSALTGTNITSAGSVSTVLIGSVTNTGTINNSTITGNVSQTTPTNLSGTTIIGNLTYGYASGAIEITYTNSSISGTVSNVGFGIVIVNLTNSTIGNSQVDSRQTSVLTLNGLRSGSQIRINDDQGNEIDYVDTSGTSYTLTTSGYTGTWTWKVAKYGYVSQSGTHSPAVGSTTTTVSLAVDAFITQANPVTVAAYTALETPDKIYDYAAYWETTNAGINTARVASKIASQVGITSYDVVFDSAATDIWLVDAGVVTIKTSTFSPGVTMTGGLYNASFVTISSGVTVTAGITATIIINAGSASAVLIANVTNTGTINNSTITGRVSQATPTNLTGTSITGNLVYNTNTAIEITLTNSSVSGTVSNVGSATVTINLSNSTIGTVGARVVSRQQSILTLNGLTAGSQIYIADGTGTQIAYVASSGTTYALTTSGYTGTWSWKIARYGFTSQSGNHFPAVGSTTVTVSLISDVFITQATKATTAAYTTLDNLDKLYDYAAYWETTNAGIIYSRVITKAGTTASAGSYNIILNASGSAWSFNGSILTLNSTRTLSAGITLTGSLFTSGTVTLTGAQTYTPITANVLQTTPVNLIGMTITGNLTYNTNATTTVTITDSTITGSINNSGTATVKVYKAGTSGWFTEGTNVLVRGLVTVKTNDNLALSTYIVKNGVTDLGWVVQSTNRSLEVAQTDTFAIFVVAYGYQRALFYPVATDFTTFTTSLIPETYVDTTLNTTNRNYIATQITTALVGYELAVSVGSDLRAYSPAEVLNGLHYYTVVYGALPAYVSILAGSVAGFAIIPGGIEISSPVFYAKVNDSITTTTDLGVLIPLYFQVTPSVYVANPSYTPTKKNSSGIVLQTAPWTQQTAVISATDKTDISNYSANAVWNTPIANVVSSNTMGSTIKTIDNTTKYISAMVS
jgi:hypothetical protein